MPISEEQVTIRKYTPDGGNDYVITNESRVFYSALMYLGVNDSKENYIEITKEQYILEQPDDPFGLIKDKEGEE